MPAIRNAGYALMMCALSGACTEHMEHPVAVSDVDTPVFAKKAKPLPPSACAFEGPLTLQGTAKFIVAPLAVCAHQEGGATTGTWKWPEGKWEGNVLEVAPPTVLRDYWCLRGSYELYPEEYPGAPPGGLADKNVLIWIRADLGTAGTGGARDEVATHRVDAAGASCLTARQPLTGKKCRQPDDWGLGIACFTRVKSGDFEGTVE